MQIKVGKIKIVIDDEYLVEGSVGSWTYDIHKKTGRGTLDLKVHIDNLVEKKIGKKAAAAIGIEDKAPAECACGNPHGTTHQKWCPIQKERDNA